MENSFLTPQRGTLALWLVIGILLVLVVAILLDISPRHLVFLATTVIGAAVLILINTTPRQDFKDIPPQLPAGNAYSGQNAPSSSTAKVAQQDKKQPTSPLSFTTPAEEKLSGDSARQWLDDFLVRQQKT